MTSDGLAGTTIAYNHLDKPRIISKNHVNSGNYSYLADGTLLSAVDGSGEGLVYRGSLIYRKDSSGTLTLESAGFDGGRITPGGVRYHVTDHLGSVVMVIDGATGTPLESGTYGEYGQRSHLAGTQGRYHFSGKEDQGPEFGIPYTDFGARHYSPSLRRWLAPDPLSEKYYGISPYAYCEGDPVNMVDPEGRDGMVTGTGSKEDPYIVTANYYYNPSDLKQEQVEGLMQAATKYNSYKGSVKDNNGNRVFVSFNISIIASDNPEADRMTTGFIGIDGDPHYYGNSVIESSTSGSNEDIYGTADNISISFNTGIISLGIYRGMDSKDLNTGVALHEIGHNLGLVHEDGTSLMETVNTIIYTDNLGKETISHTYPTFRNPNKSVGIIIRKRDAVFGKSIGMIWTRR